MKNLKKQSIIRSRLFWVVLLVVCLFIGLTFIYSLRHRSQSNTKGENGIPKAGKSKVDLSPPSEADKQQVDENKKRIVDEQTSQNQTTPSSLKAVTPIITSSTNSTDRVGVFAFIPNIVESGGTCTLILTFNELSTSGTTTASPEGTSTNCGNITITKNQLQKGASYNAVVKYESPISRGSSTQPWQIKVE